MRYCRSVRAINYSYAGYYFKPMTLNTTLDHDKDRQQLIAEINELRERVAHLESTRVDIEDFKRTKDALTKSEKNYATIFNTSPIGFIHFDTKGVVTDINPFLLDLLGSPKEKVVGVNLLTSLRNSVLVDALKMALAGETGQYSGEYTSGNGKGKSWVNVFYAPVVDSENRVAGGIGIVQDITPRKKAEKALWENERTLNTILQACPVAIGLTGYNRTLLWGNRAWLNLFGFEDSKFPVGQSARKLYESDEEFNRVTNLLYPYLEEGHAGEIDLTMVRTDGETFEAHMVLSPLDPLDPYKGVVSIIEDISWRKRIEQEKEALRIHMLQAQKKEAIGTLVGGLAHDFNNMLQIILGYTQLLMMDKAEDHEDYADLASIARTVRDGAELVNKLLMFGQEAPVRPKSVDFNKQIAELVHLAAHSFPKTMDIEFYPTDEPLFISADPNQINQAVMNILVNSSEAMPEGENITIRTRKVELDDEFCRLHPKVKPGAYVMLTVRDFGRGMDKQTLARAFEPFFSTKERDSKRGTGLGLSVTQGIVEQHGGYVSCESEPDKGTEFKLYFPALESVQNNTAEGKIFQGTNRDYPILFVEDETLLADQAKLLLNRAGYSILTASNGAEALKIYRESEGKISLVILDLIMPVMSGRDCLRELVKLDPAVKILVASGFAPDVDLGEEIKHFAKGFVTKPYDFGSLVNSIESILAAS
ncbi:MAG: PAS domain-containing hybrid sensor histidine kinase/response regulator [Desulfomonilaceae bacterium]